MWDKLFDWLIKLVIALIAVNLVWSLLLQLLLQHPFLSLLLIVAASVVAYLVRAHHSPHDGQPRRAGGHERTPMVPRGWDE